MHEATQEFWGCCSPRWVGFQSKRSIIIVATNRKQDLDAALRSRFAQSIFFQPLTPFKIDRWEQDPSNSGAGNGIIAVLEGEQLLKKVKPCHREFFDLRNIS